MAVIEYMVLQHHSLEDLVVWVNAKMRLNPRWQPRDGIVVYWDGTKGHIAYLQTMVKNE